MTARGSLCLLAAFAASFGCGDTPAEQPSRDTATHAFADYVQDPAVGRRALERSLVSRDNGYAQLRLQRYDAEHWGALPEYDPETTALRVADDGGPAPAEHEATWARVWDGEPIDSDEALRALGERAFFAYPVQLVPMLPRALQTPDRAGLWQHQGRFGAVWVRTPKGRAEPAYTCASCHATADAGVLVAGRNNADLQAGRIAGDGERGPAWGPGRVDVTADGIDNPVAITDLRPVGWQVRLHRAASLDNDPIALAVRIETLIITSKSEALRPPRLLAAALAAYLLSLAPQGSRAELARQQPEGASVFQQHCAGCHAGDGASGAGVALATVGTDPRVGESPERGTGLYRVPSLRGVGDRRRLLASGDADDLTALLDPARELAGHRYGLELSARERNALLRYVGKL